MPVKRSRVVRSSSFGETGVLNNLSPPVQSPELRWEIRTSPAAAAAAAAPKPPNNAAKILKPSVAGTDRSRPKILTLSSPVQESLDVSTEVQIGGFLEKCYYCKKKISENDEVFMYSYLRAFCSSECRDKQISMDKEVGKVSGASNETMTGHRKMNNVKDQFGSQLEKHAAP